jgi:hypothetical protein
MRARPRRRSPSTSPAPQEGTGVEPGDFLAVFDAEEGRIVHETAMPNVCDELHHYGWTAARRPATGPITRT